MRVCQPFNYVWGDLVEGWHTYRTGRENVDVCYGLLLSSLNSGNGNTEGLPLPYATDRLSPFLSDSQNLSQLLIRTPSSEGVFFVGQTQCGSY